MAKPYTVYEHDDGDYYTVRNTATQAVFAKYQNKGKAKKVARTLNKLDKSIQKNK